MQYLPFALLVTLAACQLPVGFRVDVYEVDDAVVVAIDRQHFLSYHKGGGDRTKPYIYPVYGPSHLAMTRAYPMSADNESEEQDHPHHTGIWFAHGDVNGVDFWHGPGGRHPNGGRIVQESITYYSGVMGWLHTKNRYEDEHGKVICREQRKMAFFQNQYGRFIDFDISILATEGPVTMGDTKEGIMAIRVPASLRLKGKVARGEAVISSGVKGPQGWGTRGTWADYHGYCEGQKVGVAIFDHPENPVHPTRWLIRDYGLFGANPFGLHHFEKKPKGSGSVTIPQGGTMRFRYRMFFHDGDAVTARVGEHYGYYVKQQEEAKKNAGKSGWSFRW